MHNCVYALLDDNNVGQNLKMHHLIDIKTAWSLFGQTIIKGLKALALAPRAYYRQPPARSWEARLERIIPEFRIYGITKFEPILRLKPYEPTPEQNAAAGRIRDELTRTNQHNDPYAMLRKVPTINSDNECAPLVLEADTLDWAMLSALRQTKEHQLIVSSGAVVVCRKAKKILLHRRSARSVTVPCLLHIVAGGYKPPDVVGGTDDGLSLYSAASREILEETQLVVPVPEGAIALVSEEIDNRFFQFIILGLAVDEPQLKRMRHNWEGDEVVTIGFDDLPRKLMDQSAKWTLTGYGIVLAWLARGAPGAGWHPSFGSHRPQDLFDLLVKE